MFGFTSLFLCFSFDLPQQTYRICTCVPAVDHTTKQVRQSMKPLRTQLSLSLLPFVPPCLSLFCQCPMHRDVCDACTSIERSRGCRSVTSFRPICWVFWGAVARTRESFSHCTDVSFRFTPDSSGCFFPCFFFFFSVFFLLTVSLGKTHRQHTFLVFFFFLIIHTNLSYNKHFPTFRRRYMLQK